jgi:trigger factor
MKVEIKKVDRLKRRIKVEVEGNDFLEKRKEIYKEIGKNLKVPGFRPGSAPLEILEKHHNRFLKEEFLRRALPLYYRQALEGNNIKPAGLPRIYDVELKEKKLSFYAEFEVEPEVEIKEKDYKEIKIRDKKIEVKEIEIEKVLTNLKENIKKIAKKDLDDEKLAHWLGYANLQNLREAIKGEIFVEKLRARRQEIEKQVIRHLLKTIKIDVPHVEVENYHKELVNRELYNLRLRKVPEEDLEKYRKDIEEKLKPVAEDSIKLSYIVRAIAQKEGIELQDNLEEVVLGYILSCAKYEEK